MNDRLPEEQDLEFEELITVLRQADLNPSLIDPTEYAQIISQARARLFHTDAGVFRYEDMPTDKQRGLDSLPSKPNANRDRPHRGRGLLRLASSIAAVLAVVVLIGFSLLFLSSYVGYSVVNNSRSAVQTQTVTLVQVPDLSGMTWAEASNTAERAGFHLNATDGSTDGVVVNQNPHGGDQAISGSAIEVLMGVQKVIVPTIPKNSQLDTVEQILMSSGFQYTVIPDGTNPNLKPNTVSRISPSSSSSVPSGSKIAIYVVNYTNGTPLSHNEPITTSSL